MIYSLVPYDLQYTFLVPLRITAFALIQFKGRNVVSQLYNCCDLFFNILSSKVLMRSENYSLTGTGLGASAQNIRSNISHFRWVVL